MLSPHQTLSKGGGSGSTTPVRKISAQEFERGGLIKPMVTTIDGTPTFLSPPTTTTSSDVGQGVYSRKSREELQVRVRRNEREFIIMLMN